MEVVVVLVLVLLLLVLVVRLVAGAVAGGYLAQVDAALAVPSTVSYRLKFPKTAF